MWLEAYRCIRTHHPDIPIVIIDDHSTTTYRDATAALEAALINTVVIDSDLQAGAGEMLPYVLMLRHEWFETAVVIHDSMFLQAPIVLDSTAAHPVPFRFLWHFNGPRRNDDIAGQNALISLLGMGKARAELHALRNSRDWLGCFGTCMCVRLAFLKHLQCKYGFVQMVGHITTRKQRMAIERVFALLCFHALRDWDDGKFAVSVSNAAHMFGMYGNITKTHRAFKYNMSHYTSECPENRPPMPVIKVWSGR